MSTGSEVGGIVTLAPPARRTETTSWIAPLTSMSIGHDGSSYQTATRKSERRRARGGVSV